MIIFERLNAVAAPMGAVNIDTDMIIPKQFLKVISRAGLGKALFFERRYDEQGEERPDFVLNQPAYRNARILIGGENFGCGSSREHAPWALLDFGIRCVIAPSFADIFYGNMFKNGMLPVRLPEKRVTELIQFVTELPGAEIAIDLRAKTVTGPDGQIDHLEIDEFSRKCLLQGLDEIGLTFKQLEKIRAYEAAHSMERPWI